MSGDEQNPIGRGYGQGYEYLALGFSFAFAILLFGAGGWIVDGWLHTRPLFAIGGAFLGGFGGFMVIYYRVTRETEEGKRDPKGRGEGRGKGTK